MKKLMIAAANAAVLVLSLQAHAASQGVYFVEPKNGATVTSPFKVVFGIKGMTVDPAGEIKKNSGHHHLLINAGPMKEGDVIPTDDTHMHFGKAQTEATVTLPKGKHTLQLVLGDWTHVPHNPPVVSEKITVTVQ